MSQLDSLRRILPLAWPVLVGQVALLAYSTIDTILLARYSADDLAALAVGSAIYITLFVGLMGVMMAVAPMVGRHHGAGRYQEAGEQLHQTTWLAFALMLPGILLLLHPDLLLKVSMASPAVEIKVRGYLSALACSLPPALLFTAFRGFNNAVSRPKAGYWMAFGHVDWAPASLQGAPGFWSAATAGLVIAAIGLCSLLAWVHRRERG